MFDWFSDFTKDLRSTVQILFRALGPKQLVVYTLFYLLQWTLPFIEVKLLSSLSLGKIDPQSLTIFIAVTLVMLIVGYISFLFSIRHYRLISRMYFEKIVTNGIQSNVGISKLHRLFRKFNDDTKSALDFILLMFALPFTVVAYVWYLGWVAIWVFVLVTLYLPLSSAMAGYAGKYFDKVTQATELRLKYFERIVRVAPLLSALKMLQGNRFKKLDRIFSMETRLRGWDSSLKSFEIYFGIFFRALPYVVLSAVFFLFSGWFATGDGASARELFWLSLPLIGIVLSLPGGIQSIKSTVYCDSSIAPPRKVEQTRLRIDGESKIWFGTISENTFLSEPIANQVLSLLNLNREIKFNGNLLDFQLTSEGNNLSAGQRARILTARAIGYSIALQSAVELDLEFHSLDLNNKRRIKQLLEAIPKFDAKVILSPSAMSSLDESSAASAVADHESEIDREQEEVQTSSTLTSAHSVLNSVRAYVNDTIYTFPLFLVAAGLAASVFGWVNYEGVQTEGMGSLATIVLGFALMASGMALAITSGWWVEWRIRARTMRQWLQIVAGSRFRSVRLKRMSLVDFQNLIESYSFYSHDFSWAFMVFVAAVGMAAFSTGLIGGLSVVALTFIFALVVKPLIGILVRSRASYLDANERLVETLADGQCMTGAILHSQSRDLGLRALLLSQLERWLDSVISLSRSKFYLSYAILWLTNIVLIVLFLSQIYNPKSSAVLGVMIGALMAVEAESNRLFAALTGLLTQSQSRLDFDLEEQSMREKEHQELEASEKLTNGILKVESVLVSNLKRWTKPMELHPGVVRFSGASGEGKSSVADSLVGEFLRNGVRTMYFDNHSLKELEWFMGSRPTDSERLESLWAAIEAAEPEVVVFDETFLGESVESVRSWLTDVSPRMVKNGIRAILMDHRFNIGNEITVSALLK